MDNTLKVALLFDKSNNWISKYVNEEAIIKNGLNKAYSFDIFYKYDGITGYDVVFILGFTKIIKSELLLNNSLNLVIHESNLPEGKGFSPVQWQVLEGANQIIVSLIEAGDKVDSGDIILQDILQLNGYELWPEIREKQALVTVKLIIEFLNIFPEYVKRPQKGKETFYAKRTDKDDELNVDKTLREQFNLLRIANNEEYPLHFFIDDKKYTVKIYKED